MIRTFRGVKGLGIAALTMAAAAGCATTPYTTTTPVAVQASTPTVTYNYRTDAELLQANQNAITYCGQYQTTPRTGSITGNADGSKTVVFDCVGPVVASTAPAPVVPPGMRYSYRTDQDLVQASQTASAYCARTGALPMTSNIITNADGSRTVVFQCSR
ncbi:MAG TPA: hypothetical protein VL948_10655 [Verrucomicrobiae bacterium]|jgi:hypothetical protein|nr:hypothetical protein [Verrucomicrobiae bacterium]